MTPEFMQECLHVLERTPPAVSALLGDLPDAWTKATDGPGAWSAYDVVGHLIHGEKTDWMPRLEIILQYGAQRPFEPFDREAQFRQDRSVPLNSMLQEFASLRRGNLDRLHRLNLQPDQLDLAGLHPALGRVTLRQLLATWTAHDLGHLVQISRTMARRLKPEVGPWTEYMSVMK